MKNFTNQLFKAFVLCILSFTVFSCSKDDDPMPETSMEFTVIDEVGNTVSGASIMLYSDEEGYIKEDPAKLVTSVETSSDGIAVIKDIEPKKYWFSVTHGTTDIKTNWEGGSVTQEPLAENIISTFRVVIQTSDLGYLAGKGKSWKYSKFYINKIDYSSEFSCNMDNIATFYKDLTVLFSEGGIKCDNSVPQEYNGTFKISKNWLITYDDIYGEDAWHIESISSSSITLAQYDADGNEYALVLEASY